MGNAGFISSTLVPLGSGGVGCPGGLEAFTNLGSRFFALGLKSGYGVESSLWLEVFLT